MPTSGALDLFALRAANRLVGNREDALDLCQDAFLKAYRNLGKLDDPGRFAPWLFRIAHNEAFSLLRKPRAEAGHA